MLDPFFVTEQVYIFFNGVNASVIICASCSSTNVFSRCRLWLVGNNYDHQSFTVFFDVFYLINCTKSVIPVPIRSSQIQRTWRNCVSANDWNVAGVFFAEIYSYRLKILADSIFSLDDKKLKIFFYFIKLRFYKIKTMTTCFFTIIRFSCDGRMSHRPVITHAYEKV